MRQNIHRMVLWIYLMVNGHDELIDLVLTPGIVFPDSRADSSSETRDTYRGCYEINSFNVQLIAR